MPVNCNPDKNQLYISLVMLVATNRRYDTRTNPDAPNLTAFFEMRRRYQRLHEKTLRFRRRTTRRPKLQVVR